MELIVFIVLIVLGFFTLIIEDKNLLKWLYIPSAFIFMIIVRFSGFDADIITYGKEMHSVSYDIYYLREFIFWYSLRFLYFLFQNEIIVFIILDFIWIYTLIKIQKTMIVDGHRLEKGLIIVLLTCFPFLFGYENIYRQFFAAIILLYSYSLIESDYKKAIKLFILSFFIHNIVVLILPLFIIKKFFRFRLKDRITIAICLSFLFVLSLGFLTLLKSSEPTRLDMSSFYLMLFSLFFVISLISFRENIYKLFKVVPSLLFSVILMAGLVNLDVDMIAERLGMMFIIFLLFDLYKYSNTIEGVNRKLLRVSLLLGFSIPVFLFASSMKFLM